jgi:serine phosphatase RsbU (regulator of sigma subunit)
MEKASYQTSTTQLSPGDRILLFTDGLVEAQNQKEEIYDQELLLAAVQTRFELPTPRLFDDILEEVHRFSTTPEFADDVCLVGIELVNGS